MNLKKGFKRLTLVLSLLSGPFVLFCFCIYFNEWPGHTSELLFGLLLFEVIGFVVVWIIYWIVKGFPDNKKKRIWCLWIGISLIVLMGLFPPVLRKSTFNNRYVKYSFILNASGPIVLHNLIVQWIVVSAITGGLIYTFRDKKLKDE